jgi:hypothetical protein
MILSSHGVIASQIASFVGLLDLYPNAAAAYSVRKLRSAYTGNAIRVRRSSDNTEQDIGFTALGGLDTTTLTSFCSGTNGFVTTWYDQSGNTRNVVQSTASRQPQIVSSGSIILQNGKPSITHVASTDLKLSTALNIGTTHTMLGVISPNALNREFIGNGGNWSYAMYNSSTKVDTEARKAVGSTTASFGTGYAFFQYYRGGTVNVSIYKNSSLLGGSSFNLASNNDFDFKSLSGEELDAYNFTGNMSEVVIYTTNQSSNRTGIESNINTYYAIY